MDTDKELHGFGTGAAYKSAIVDVGDRMFKSLLQNYADGEAVRASDMGKMLIGLPLDQHAMHLMMAYLARKAKDGGLLLLVIPILKEPEDTMTMVITDFELRLVEATAENGGI